MINRAAPLPITQPCRILDVCRSSVYYKPVPLADRNLTMMRRIDLCA
jgi:putative transposase